MTNTKYKKMPPITIQPGSLPPLARVQKTKQTKTPKKHKTTRYGITEK